MQPQDKLPKEELLLKLLRLTTSMQDGEALAAIRKANDLLRNSKWDWDMLIRAKIKVVNLEDPFKTIAHPQNDSNLDTIRDLQNQIAHLKQDLQYARATPPSQRASSVPPPPLQPRQRRKQRATLADVTDDDLRKLSF